MLLELMRTLLEDPTFQSKVKCSTKTFAPNEVILSQGELHHTIFLINKGMARVIVHSEIKENSPLKPGIADLGPNDIFGEFGLFDELPASADVMALVESEL